MHYIPEVKVVHGEEDINSQVDPYMSYDYDLWQKPPKDE